MADRHCSQQTHTQLVNLREPMMGDREDGCMILRQCEQSSMNGKPHVTLDIRRESERERERERERDCVCVCVSCRSNCSRLSRETAVHTHLHSLPLPRLTHASVPPISSCSKAPQIHPIEGPAAKLALLKPLAGEVFALAHTADPTPWLKSL